MRFLDRVQVGAEAILFVLPLEAFEASERPVEAHKNFSQSGSSRRSPALFAADDLLAAGRAQSRLHFQQRLVSPGSHGGGELLDQLDRKVDAGLDRTRLDLVDGDHS